MNASQTLVDDATHPTDSFYGRWHQRIGATPMKKARIRRLRAEDSGLYGRTGVDYCVTYSEGGRSVVTPKQYREYYRPVERSASEMVVMRLYGWLQKSGVPLISNMQLVTDQDAEGVALQGPLGIDPANPNVRLLVRGPHWIAKRALEVLLALGVKSEIRGDSGGLCIEFPIRELERELIASSMAPDEVPEVHFDSGIAVPIYPRPNPKHAVLVVIPLTHDDAEIPTFIQPEWGGVQVFYGSYYGIINEQGSLSYGSAQKEWEEMHRLIKPGYWVKIAIPTAYQAATKCSITTMIPSEDGGIREAKFILLPGDWIVRQPAGEVQHIKAAKFNDIYFSEGEAASLGLIAMSADAFAEWAIEAARTSMI